MHPKDMCVRGLFVCVYFFCCYDNCNFCDFHITFLKRDFAGNLYALCFFALFPSTKLN